MNFALSDEQEALKRVVRSFADKEIREQAAVWNEREEFPSEVMLKMGQMGLLGLLIPEVWGGSDAGMVAFVAAMEEIGSADQSVAAAWNAHSTMGMLGLLHYGTDEQRERWLRPLAEGRAIGAFGLTEPDAGSDAAGIRTVARRIDGGWSINGSKTFISNAGTPISLGVTVLARFEGDPDGERRYGAFFVETGTEGYTFGQPMKKLGWHGLDNRPLFFDNCIVGEDHVVGEVGDGLRDFLSILDPGRISVAALSVSPAAECLTMSLEYAREREQFGRRLSGFQAIQHKLADMATEVEAARLLVYSAAAKHDAGEDCRREAAMAKLSVRRWPTGLPVRRSRSTVGSAKCVSHGWRGSILMRRSLRSGRGRARSSETSSLGSSAAEMAKRPPPRSAIVTGSSRGLGHAIAAELLGDGWAVTLHGGDEQRLAAITERLGAIGSVNSFAADLRDKSACRRLVIDHLESFGQLDALVVDVAMASPAWIGALGDDAADEQISMNLASAFSLVGAALPHLEAAAHAGRIMVVSSIAAQVPINRLSVYSATMAALLSLSRSINLEYSCRNVRSTAITPGYIDTDLAAGGVVADAEQMMSADYVVQVVRFILNAPSSLILGECSVTRAVSPLFET